jgi:hypothetical protein
MEHGWTREDAEEYYDRKIDKLFFFRTKKQLKDARNLIENYGK